MSQKEQSQSEQVIRIISDVLEIPVSSLTPSTKFHEDLNVSSLQVVDVIWRLEEVLALPETQPTTFQNVTTVGQMIDIVDEALAKRAAEEQRLAEELKCRANDKPYDIVVSCDHAGVRLKGLLIDYLRRHDYLVLELGPKITVSVDYPSYAHEVATTVVEGKARFGLLICGTGIGMSMTANRHPGIRAAVVTDPISAKLTRKHNNANVLCLGARIIGPEIAEACLEAFLTTSFDPGADGRHRRRVNMIDSLTSGEDVVVDTTQQV